YNGAPLWASLFSEGPQEQKKAFAPWYRREGGVWCERSWSEMVCSGASWEGRRYVAMDVETTGLYPQSDRIVEIALVRFSFDREGAIIEEESFSSLINPLCPIPAKVQAIHGIGDAEVAHAPTFREVARTVIEFINERIAVGHNVRFDIDFIETELARAEQPLLLAECADSLGMAKIAFPGMRSYNLGMLSYSLKLPSDAQHRALGDALTSMRLFAAAARLLSGHCS
ncbi:MAG: 3'-5' exonuclease, partial [Rectinema sp.]|nr:3'-5' exonuclease [Rectinema sp.]